MLVLAHSGHWAAQIVYLAPVIAAGGWLLLDRIRERRRGPGG